MPRRPATVTQADVARTIRAAKKAGAEGVEVRPDGTISIILKGVAIAPTAIEDQFEKWERENEQAKAARHRKRD
jgi:hypothetical protein